MGFNLCGSEASYKLAETITSTLNSEARLRISFSCPDGGKH
jgi:hypothetical protein